MPIYEYRCESCGRHLEVIQRMSDSPLQDCPSCRQPSLRKLVSAAGFRLKGSGWYATDFKGDNQAKKGSATEANSKEKGAGTEAKNKNKDKADSGAKKESGTASSTR